MQRSAPRRGLVVLLSLFLGGFFGIGGAFFSAFFKNAGDDKVEKEKLREIRERLTTVGWEKEKQTT
jgi:uncharacterized protein involved in exopolysaccharide biosynthesis